MTDGDEARRALARARVPSPCSAAGGRGRTVQRGCSPSRLHAVGDQPSRSQAWSGSSGCGSSSASTARRRSASRSRARRCSRTPLRSRHASAPRRPTSTRSRAGWAGRAEDRRLRERSARDSSRRFSSGSSGVFPEHRRRAPRGTARPRLLRALERGVLDVAFVDLPVPPGPSGPRPSSQSLYVLVARVGSEYAGMCPRGRSPTWRACRWWRSRVQRIDPVAGQLRAIGLDANVVIRSDYNEAVQGYAAAGLGVGLMPRLAVNFEDERTVVIELGDLVPPRRIAAAWHPERTPSRGRQGADHDRDRGRLEPRRARTLGRLGRGDLGALGVTAATIAA